LVMRRLPWIEKREEIKKVTSREKPWNEWRWAWKCRNSLCIWIFEKVSFEYSTLEICTREKSVFGDIFAPDVLGGLRSLQLLIVYSFMEL
jgi:hypothetical protein